MSNRVNGATWLDPGELAKPQWQLRDDAGQVAGLFLGHHNGRAVGSTDDRPVVTIAGAASGKGACLLVPNLLMYDGSALVIDIGGDLARVTAAARRKKRQKIVVLDPFGVSDQRTGHYNPLAELNSDDHDIKDQAALIADALIIANQHDAYWTDQAKMLVKALVLLTLTMPEQEQNLSTSWQLLTGTHPAVDSIARRYEIDRRSALLKLMAASYGIFDNTVAVAGSQLLAMAERHVASVFSTAQTQLSFLDNPAMADVLATSEFRLSELKTGRATLYLCLPATRLEAYARWLRIIISQAVLAFKRTTAKPDIPTLLVLDYFASLGRLKAIEVPQALPSLGLRPWLLVNSLAEVKRELGDNWEAFVAQAGVSDGLVQR